MRRGQSYGNQVCKGIMGLGKMRMDRFHDARGVMRARDCENGGVGIFYQIGFDPETAGHDNFPILCESFPDRAERFLDCGVDEAASVDDDEIGAGVIGRGGVALGAQLREDALRVDERLGTA